MYTGPLGKSFATIRQQAYKLPEIPPYTREDYFQTGCAELFRATKQFDATRGVAFETYMYPKTYGVMLDLLRKRPQNRIVLKNEKYFARRLNHNETPEKITSRNQMKQRVREAIDKLVPRDREIVIDLFYNDLSLTEIAKKQSVTLPYISRRYKKIREQLRKLLQKTYDEYKRTL